VLTPTNSYILGILWGTLSYYSEGFWLRHRDHWYINTVRDYLELSPAGHESYSPTGRQHRLKITSRKDVAKITKILSAHGWAPRKAQVRPYPLGNIDDRSFIRAWTELHGHADIRRARGRDGSHFPQRRLRIYGNFALLEEINLILSSACNLRPRKLQGTSNEITKALYYQGKNVLPVMSWLYAEASIFNPSARTSFWETLSLS